MEVQAFEKIFIQYLPIVYKMQSRYLIKGFDSDDWLQEGRIALNDALRSYKKGYGTTFGLYYKMIFENRVRSLIRRQQAKKRLIHQQAVSIEKVSGERYNTYFKYHDCMEENVCISDVLLSGEIWFSPLENHVLLYYLRGEEPEVIAQRLNRSVKKINNALCRAKKKIKEKLYEEEE